MSRDWLRMLACTLLFLGSERARADSTCWQAPAGCPGADAAQAVLRERQGAESAFERGRARVKIDRAPTGELRAQVWLELSSGSEQRVLFGQSCDALAEAALLVISMAFEAEPEEGRPAPEHAGPTPKHSGQAPEHAAEPARTGRREGSSTPLVENAAPPPARGGGSHVDKKRSSGEPVRIGVAGVLELGHGALPSSDVGGSGGLVVARGRLWGELRGSYWAERDIVLTGAVHGRAQFGLVTGSGRVCYLAGERALVGGMGVGPCAALELGSARGRGAGFAHGEATQGLWVAGLAGVMLGLGPFGRLAPAAQLELGVALRRPRFRIDDLGTVHQADVLLMRGALGLVILLR
jgi:hypothetical protein